MWVSVVYTVRKVHMVVTYGNRPLQLPVVTGVPKQHIIGEHRACHLQLIAPVQQDSFIERFLSVTLVGPWGQCAPG